jgi:hypothetical protein
MTAAREEALERIAALVRQHGIGMGEIAARLKEDESSGVMDKGGSVLKTSLGYVGGTLIFFWRRPAHSDYLARHQQHRAGHRHLGSRIDSVYDGRAVSEGPTL